MKVHFIRTGDRRYGVRIERDATPSLVMDPAPGFDPDLPHDMVHFAVEAALGLKSGVFGQIAAGGNAGSFHIGGPDGGDAREHRRAARKQASKGQKLVQAQGREGELSEIAAFLFDVVRPQVFEDFERLSQAWRGLRVGEALVLEWPSGQPIG